MSAKLDAVVYELRADKTQRGDHSRRVLAKLDDLAGAVDTSGRRTAKAVGAR
jgi:hypothetical protein